LNAGKPLAVADAGTAAAVLCPLFASVGVCGFDWGLYGDCAAAGAVVENLRARAIAWKALLEFRACIIAFLSCVIFESYVRVRD